MELKRKDKKALEEFKNWVIKEFPAAQFTLFGSKVKSQDDESSDIDVLVILRREVDTDIERKIFGIGFEIGLKFGVVFGIIVEEDKSWNSSLSKATPFYQNVTREGISI